MSEKIYAERDIIGMDSKGGHYCRHISAMTREGLHSKSDIAAELGFRDMVIAELEAKCAALAAELQAVKNYRPQPSGAAMMEALDAFYEYHEDVPEQGMMAAFEILCCKRPETPSTDAFLAEVRAQGVEMFANWSEKHIENDDEYEDVLTEVSRAARGFANQLRKDANTAELVAAGIITKVGE
ncbi:MAG: hypothetical protein E6736_00795 [Leclercia adecarboxylata]|nr:hypothetical protein [Leclercia adecarboxylata]